jgi:hypothetical protein
MSGAPHRDGGVAGAPAAGDRCGDTRFPSRRELYVIGLSHGLAVGRTSKRRHAPLLGCGRKRPAA